jgi:thiol:disulfide interchange protein
MHLPRPLSAFALALAAISCSASQPAPQPPPQLIAGPNQASDLAPAIARERAAAEAQHARLLVYVGASWCEPCRRFHDALASGQLDATLRGVRFLEFDHDQAKEALARAGYQSQLIPLFALPRADGSASEQRIEGSIKGDSAVSANLLPRLRDLLAGGRD